MTFSVLRPAQDSGPPDNSTDYTTLVILHGYLWHSGILSKLIPIARNYNTRLVLVDRRDYPTSIPYTDEERALLPAVGEDASEKEVAQAEEKLLLFMKARARELYDFLEDLVRGSNMPPAQPEKNKGGIVVAGWSWGTMWMTALLAFVSSFPVKDINLSTYVRRVILYDPAYYIIGYPHPEDAYNPMLDMSLRAEERKTLSDIWATGYFAHGDTPETLEKRTPIENPKPTITNLSAEEHSSVVCHAPAEPGGSDVTLLHSSQRTNLSRELLTRALYLSNSEGRVNAQDADGSGDDWRNVELRVVWCQQSIWWIPYGIWALQAEVEDARSRGVSMRDPKIVCIRKGNHFVHWDHPDWALRALVGNEDEI